MSEDKKVSSPPEMEVVWRIGAIHQEDPVAAVQEAVELLESNPLIYQYEVTRKSDGFTWFVEMAEGLSKVQDEKACPLNKFLIFLYNYERDWVAQAFADDPHLAKHFGDRFLGYWKELTASNGSSGASFAVIKTLLTMSLDNSRIVWNYINNKY